MNGSQLKKLENFDILFRTDYTYEKELIDVLPLKGNSLHKAELEYHGKVWYTIGRIQHIVLLSRIGSCYSICHVSNQAVAHILTGFQGIKCYVKCLDSHPHKPIFDPSNSYDGSNIIIFT